MPVSVRLRQTVFDADNLRVFVIAPVRAVFDRVKATIGPDFQVHRSLKCHLGTEAFHRFHFVVRIEMDRNNPVAGPFVDKKSVIEFSREFRDGRILFVEIIDRTGHCCSATRTVDDRKVREPLPESAGP